jgi:hypothetical protein
MFANECGAPPFPGPRAELSERFRNYASKEVECCDGFGFVLFRMRQAFAKPFLEFGLVACFAFPYNQDMPSELLQFAYISFIAFDIASQLSIPEVRPCFRQRRVGTARVVMPKAAVYKNYGFESGQHNIRIARQILTVQ